MLDTMTLQDAPLSQGKSNIGCSFHFFDLTTVKSQEDFCEKKVFYFGKTGLTLFILMKRKIFFRVGRILLLFLQLTLFFFFFLFFLRQFFLALFK